ncbi:hypothetical protein ACP70R_015860 [Stipagrostis hirtigluma subsp. patula]
MAVAPLQHSPFHLAFISLALLALIPHTAAIALVLPGAHSAAPRRLQASAGARHGHGTTAPPSAAPAAPPRAPDVLTLGVAPAITRYSYWCAVFAALRDVCQPPLCLADSNGRLRWVVVGPHRGSRKDSGSVHERLARHHSCGDVCRVELGHMDYERSNIDCPPTTCLSYCTESPEDALQWAIDAIASPCGVVGVTSTTSGAAPSTTNAALLAALPLLAIAFLPPPVAAAVVVSSLASVVRADLSEDEYLRLNHATCAVYPYDNATGTVERVRPVPGLRAVCLRPLCIDADPEERTLSVAYVERHGRRDNPLRVYCAVHSVEGASSPSVFFPWRNIWRAHVPVTDPDAAAASGDNVCYVELAHMDYREGYFIRCPAGDGHAHASCTEFPEEAVASAVWKHRSMTYRDTAGPKCDMYKNGAAGTQFGEYDYDADL